MVKIQSKKVSCQVDLKAKELRITNKITKYDMLLKSYVSFRNAYHTWFYDVLMFFIMDLLYNGHYN